jgi:hypothetical protein
MGMFRPSKGEKDSDIYKEWTFKKNAIFVVENICMISQLCYLLKSNRVILSSLYFQ